MREEERYARVNEQMKELSAAAKADTNPATNMLRAMLHAEMWWRNELMHCRVMEVRAEFAQTLWARICACGGEADLHE